MIKAKRTSTKSGMHILTIKAFGFYLNMSFGRSKAKPAAAPVVNVQHAIDRLMAKQTLILIKADHFDKQGDYDMFLKFHKQAVACSDQIADLMMARSIHNLYKGV